MPIWHLRPWQGTNNLLITFHSGAHSSRRTLLHNLPQTVQVDTSLQSFGTKTYIVADIKFQAERMAWAQWYTYFVTNRMASGLIDDVRTVFMYSHWVEKTVQSKVRISSLVLLTSKSFRFMSIKISCGIYVVWRCCLLCWCKQHTHRLV